MTSVKNIFSKITLLERKVKYGNNGGINVNGGMLEVDISKNTINMKSTFLADTLNNKIGISTITPLYLLDVSGSFRSRSLYDVTDCTGNVGQILSQSNQYNSTLSWGYQGNQYQAYDMFPEDSVFQVPYGGNTSGNSFKNGPGVLGQNGIMYFAPNNDTYFSTNSVIFIYNPYNGSRSWVTVGLNSDKNNFSGGSMVAPNGSIYFLPYGNIGNVEGFDSDASGILVVNPYTRSGNSMKTLVGNDVNPTQPSQLSCEYLMTDLSSEGGLGWRGIAGRYILSPTGSSGPNNAKTILYGIPYNSSNVLKINWRTNTTNLTDLSGLTVANYPQLRTDISKCYGGVLAPNGKIYCIPNNASCVPIITPNLTGSDTIDLSSIQNINTSTYPFIGSNDNKWRGGCLGPDGKIYCAPFNTSCVLIIDPSNNTINLTDISGVSGSYCGAVLAPNGKIYCAPWGGTNALVIDPINKTRSYISLPGSSNYYSFGPVVTPQGQVCLSPWRQVASSANQCMYVIKTGLPKHPPWMLAPEFNKV